MLTIRKNIKESKTYWFLAFILVISLLVRVYNLGTENFWSDEAVTVYYSHKSVLDNIKWSSTIGYFPLYHIMISSWEKFFGISEFSLRFFSVIFGTLSVYLVFLIAAFMFNKKVGIYSAIIMAVSSFNVHYSQEARVYTLFLFLSLASIYFYLKYIKSAKKRHLVCYAIFTFFMLNSHSPSIFVLVFQNLHYFLFVRRNIKKWILVQFLLLLLLIPLLWITTANIAKLSRYLIVPQPDLVTLMRTFYIFSAGSTYELKAMIFGSIQSLLFSLLIFLVALQVFKSRKTIGYSGLSKIVFLFLWLGIPVLLLAMQAYVYYSIYFENYIIESSIALYILTALCISRFKRKLQLITMAFIIMLSLSILFFDFKIQSKEEWRDVANFIKSNKNKEDAVVINVHPAIYAFTYYFDSICFKNSALPKIYTKIDCMSRQNIYGVKNIEELPKEVTEKEKVFLILWNSKYVDIEGKLLKYFSANYKLIEEKNYRHMQVYVFLK